MSINTVIEHVTVYREGALVRRTGSSPGNGGNPSKGEIAICGLPLSMNDDSVRAGISDGGIRNVRVILEVPKPDPDLKVSENIELKKTRRSVQRLHRELSELNESIERTRNITWPERPTPKDPDDVIASPLEDRSSFAEYIKDRCTELMDRRKNLMTSLKEASETLQLLEDREKGATSAKQNRINELRKTVILSIDKDRQPKGRVKFYVEYLIPGAKWAAAYSLRFNSDFSDSILESKAMVSQYSGEDWKGVSLTLSTALPHRWYHLPELRARKIGRAVSAKPKSGWREPPAGAEKLYSDFDSFMGSRVSIRSSEVISPELESEIEEDYDEEFPAEMMKSSYAGEMAEEPPETASRKKERMADMGAPMKPMKKAASLRKEPSVPDVMLDYDSLRLEDAESGPRTGLKVLSKRERYSELLSDAAENGDENLMNSIDRMESLALEVSRSDPPNGCVFPYSVDGYDYAFNADSPVSIDSDGRYHSVPLQSRRMTSSMKYIVVPRIDRSVFGTAELKNEGTAPLMPGPVDIRVASDFLCTGSFDLVPAGGIAELGLGVEQGIKVARNTQFREQTSGIAGGNLGLMHEIRIEVNNMLKRHVDLEVRERIPTNRTDQLKSDEKVKIDVVSVQPEWEAFDQAPEYIDGAYRWCLGLDPGERIELKAEYEINIPSSTEVVGGNNREAE